MRMEAAEMAASEEAWKLLEASPSRDLSTRLSGVEVISGAVLHCIDSSGARHLIVPVGEEVDMEDRQSRGVSVVTRQLIDPQAEVERRFIDVRCEDASLKDLFSVFCDELLVKLESAPTTPSTVVKAIMIRWRDLLGPSRSTLLSEGAIKGLLGELHFLEEIASISPVDALLLWTGADRSRHDFIGGRVDVEVKASSLADGLTVHISGLRQLEGPASGGELFLLVEQMEKVPVGGDAIPDAVERLVRRGVDRFDLLRKLSDVGAHAADFTAYRRIRYASRESRAYLVDEAFPRITPSSVTALDHLDRFSRVEYWLDLAGEPPSPIPRAERDQLAASILRSSKETD